MCVQNLIFCISPYKKKRMCTCPETARVLLSWGMSSCRYCGCTYTASIGNVVNYAVPCPNRAPYSRRKRFMRLLANTFASRVSKIGPELINALITADPKSTMDIYHFIRMAKNRIFKRYDAIGYLSYHLVGTKIKPLSLTQQKWAEYIFREIQWLHGRNRGTFPAYSWILEQVLCTLGRSDLLPYVHLLKCKRRRAVYHATYGHVFKGPCEPESRATIASL